MKGYSSAHPLFDTPDQGSDPAVPVNSTVAEWDVPRLTKQHHAILSRLREGPATGPQLACIAIRYSARLEELKRAGYPWLKTPCGNGQFEYRLVDRSES